MSSSSNKKKQEEASTQVTRNGGVDDATSKDESKAKKPPLASVGQVFSFARTTKTKLQMMGAFFFALISGATFPGECGEEEYLCCRQSVKLFLGRGTFSSFLICMSTAMIFYFAEVFEDLSANTADDDFMDTIRSMVYAFLLLGVIILLSMTTQNFLAEAAAETMTRNLKTDWFRALLRQDMAYYDIRDVSGEATIISSNGNRYHRTWLL